MAEGVHISVNGDSNTIGTKFLWEGFMLQNVAIIAIVIGYTNASWRRYQRDSGCRLLRIMLRKSYTVVISPLDNEDKTEHPVDLSGTRR